MREKNCNASLIEAVEKLLQEVENLNRKLDKMREFIALQKNFSRK